MTTILVLSSVLLCALCVAASFDLDLSSQTTVGGPIIGAIVGAVGHHLASVWLARCNVEESQANRRGEIGPALRQSDEVLNRLRKGIKDDPTGREFFIFACNFLGRRHGPLSFVVGRDFVRFDRMLEQLER